MENMENMQNQKVTSIEELKSYLTEGELVRLPDFAEGKPFYAKLKRPSMMYLAKSGKIPNSLLDSAGDLFQNGKIEQRPGKSDPEALTKMFEIVDIICEASFVEPTYKQLVENEIELTDEQYMAIFNYSQIGVKSLENFR